MEITKRYAIDLKWKDLIALKLDFDKFEIFVSEEQKDKFNFLLSTDYETDCILRVSNSKDEQDSVTVGEEIGLAELNTGTETIILKKDQLHVIKQILDKKWIIQIEQCVMNDHNIEYYSYENIQNECIRQELFCNNCEISGYLDYIIEKQEYLDK